MNECRPTRKPEVKTSHVILGGPDPSALIMLIMSCVIIGLGLLIMAVKWLIALVSR